MITFFIKDGENERGPFTIEQLKLRSLARDTLVWHAALNLWSNASSVYELRELFDERLPIQQENKIKKLWNSNLLKPPFKKIP